MRRALVHPLALGLLLLALGQGEPRLTPKLGGFKPTCCGSVEIQVSRLAVVGDARAAYADLDLPTAPATADYLAAARSDGLIVAAGVDALADILRLDPNRTCPSGNY